MPPEIQVKKIVTLIRRNTRRTLPTVVRSRAHARTFGFGRTETSKDAAVRPAAGISLMRKGAFKASNRKCRARLRALVRQPALLHAASGCLHHLQGREPYTRNNTCHFEHGLRLHPVTHRLSISPNREPRLPMVFGFLAPLSPPLELSMAWQPLSLARNTFLAIADLSAGDQKALSRAQD